MNSNSNLLNASENIAKPPLKSDKLPLRCTICSNVYDDSQYKPCELLSCSHMLCTECLENISDKKCPTCCKVIIRKNIINGKEAVNNTESLKLIKSQIEQHTSELIKEIYKQRDQLRYELKTAESTQKKKLTDQNTKDKQQVDNSLKEAKKGLVDKNLNVEHATKLISNINAQSQDLEKKIEKITKLQNQTDYKFKPNENLEIIENFFGKIKKISKVKIVFLNIIKRISDLNKL